MGEEHRKVWVKSLRNAGGQAIRSPLKPTIRSVAAAQDSFQRWWEVWAQDSKSVRRTITLKNNLLTDGLTFERTDKTTHEQTPRTRESHRAKLAWFIAVPTVSRNQTSLHKIVYLWCCESAAVHSQATRLWESALHARSFT